MFWLHCLSFGLLVKHIFLDNQLNKMKRAVETDSGDDCTTLRTDSIPLNCKLQDRDDKFYVMCISHNKKFGGKNRQIERRSQTWKSNMQRLKPSHVSPGRVFLCPQVWATVTEVHGQINHMEKARLPVSSVSEAKERRELDKGVPEFHPSLRLTPSCIHAGQTQNRQQRLWKTKLCWNHH